MRLAVGLSFYRRNSTQQRDVKAREKIDFKAQRPKKDQRYVAKGDEAAQSVNKYCRTLYPMINSCHERSSLCVDYVTSQDSIKNFFRLPSFLPPFVY